MKLYTAFARYFATGEGMTHMVVVSYAQDEEDIKKKFADHFSAYMAIGVEIHEGIVEQELVLTGPILESLRRSEAKQGWIDYYAQLHVNFS